MAGSRAIGPHGFEGCRARRYTVDVEALERTIEEGMLAGHVPGLALAVVKDREVVYARGFGVTNAEESGQPVTADTLFRIASTTKPLTGTAIMRLVEAGVLD